MRPPRYVRLLLRPVTLDFEEAIWELYYLIVSPRRVYKSLHYRQQTKNQWARDDPSFMVLLTTLMAISALAWGFAYAPSFFGIVRLILYMILVDFFATGVVLASIAYLLVNSLMRKPGTNSQQPLEWAYCFDVHTNAFLAIYMWLYVIQFLLLPLLDRSNWISVFLGNTLYFVAYSHYFILTFLGYSMLSFLQHTDWFLAMIGVGALVYIPTVIMKVSIVKVMLEQYFN